MTQVDHFLTNIGPDSSLATKIRPLPFYTAEESNACKSLVQSEVIYLTREGDQVNNRALYTWLKLGWSSPSVILIKGSTLAPIAGP